MTARARFRGVISVGNYTLPQGEALIITLYRAAEADRRNTAGKRIGKKMSKSVDKGSGVWYYIRAPSAEIKNDF